MAEKNDDRPALAIRPVWRSLTAWAARLRKAKAYKAQHRGEMITYIVFEEHPERQKDLETDRD